MPRIPRGLEVGGVAHVLNRGNAKQTVFHTAGEYEGFIELLHRAKERHPVDLLAFCIMPNHFHVVVRVDQTADLSALMQWWMTSHVRRLHKRNATSGHIWQGRFKSFPIQEDEHLLTVLRYVLLNPCRANLVQDPWAWRFSSLWYDHMLASWPVKPPVDARVWLSESPDEDDAADVRRSIRRGTPYGDEAWQQRAASEWGLEPTLNPRGRPRQQLALPPEHLNLFK
ncbi:MAG: transposase [Myxococcaceae bacterium]|nr:transposase [Myxococcaceae bacterium]